MEYQEPRQIGNGWWFPRVLDDGTKLWFGPYVDEWDCHRNLQNMRREALSVSQGLQQNLSDNPTWRQVVRDVFGPTSIEGYPPRGSRG